VEADEFGTALLLADHPWLLRESGTNKQLAKLLQHADGRVAEGAMVVLANLGLAASETFPVALRTFRETKDPERRAMFARLLPSISGVQELGELEKAAQEEESETTRRALEDAVARIRSLRPGNDSGAKKEK